METADLIQTYWRKAQLAELARGARATPLAVPDISLPTWAATARSPPRPSRHRTAGRRATQPAPGEIVSAYMVDRNHVRYLLDAAMSPRLHPSAGPCVECAAARPTQNLTAPRAGAKYTSGGAPRILACIPEHD